MVAHVERVSRPGEGADDLDRLVTGSGAAARIDGDQDDDGCEDQQRGADPQCASRKWHLHLLSSTVLGGEKRAVVSIDEYGNTLAQR
jgi:hypothetical protein